MIAPENITHDLNQHWQLCQDLLAIIEREAQALRRDDQPSLFEFYQARKSLLPRFSESLDSLRRHRIEWKKLSEAEREAHPEVTSSLRRNQELTMKLILLDRENEQGLLRRGLIPARELPSVNQQRPHFVAQLYRRQSQS